MGESTLYLGALVAYPLSPHGREVWNRQGQVTLRVANPVVGHSPPRDGEDATAEVRVHQGAPGGVADVGDPGRGDSCGRGGSVREVFG